MTDVPSDRPNKILDKPLSVEEARRRAPMPPISISLGLSQVGRDKIAACCRAMRNNTSDTVPMSDPREAKFVIQNVIASRELGLLVVVVKDGKEFDLRASDIDILENLSPFLPVDQLIEFLQPTFGREGNGRAWFKKVATPLEIFADPIQADPINEVRSLARKMSLAIKEKMD